MSDRQFDYLFVTNIPSPYQVDFFSALQEHRPGAFRVIFCAPSEQDRDFRLPQSFAFAADVMQSRGRRLRKDWHRNRELRGMLSAIRARLMVIGGSYLMPDARVARSVAMSGGLPWIYWGEDPFKKPAGAIGRWLKRRYVRWFLGSACGAIGVGRAAAEAYGQLLGGRPVVSIPYAPNLEHLLKPAAQLRQAALDCRRKLLGDSRGPLILFAGSLVRRKAPDVLVEAFAQTSGELPEAHLVLAGAGPMQEELEQLARRLGIENRVHLLGFLHGPDLAAVYLACDVFVLPSRWYEGWGVVVQEALAAGLPVILSDKVGAAPDLVIGQDTGVVFASENRSELAMSLIGLCRNAGLRQRKGQAGRALVASTSADAAAAAFLRFADDFLRAWH